MQFAAVIILAWIRDKIVVTAQRHTQSTTRGNRKVGETSGFLSFLFLLAQNATLHPILTSPFFV
jgi:hypothetical protein